MYLLGEVSAGTADSSLSGAPYSNSICTVVFVQQSYILSCFLIWWTNSLQFLVMLSKSVYLDENGAEQLFFREIESKH